MHVFQLLAGFIIGAGAVAIKNQANKENVHAPGTFQALKGREGSVTWHDPYTMQNFEMNCTRTAEADYCCRTDMRDAIKSEDSTYGSELCELSSGKKHHLNDDKRKGNHSVTYDGEHGKSPEKLGSWDCQNAMSALRAACPTESTVNSVNMTYGGVLFKGEWVFSVNVPLDNRTHT